MKKILSIVMAFLTALTVNAQQKSYAVSITVTGNKNLQITVDGTNYSLTNSNVAGNTTIAINNLGTGQHSIQFTRSTQNNQTERTATIFNLRYGFDMLYQTIRQQSSVSTQMNSLINVFNNTNNHFSSYQASQLIQIVRVFKFESFFLPALDITNRPRGAPSI